MLIKRIDGSTRQLGAPADWDGKDMSCGVLPILDVQTAEGNFMFSAWEPTPPELEALNKGANILLGVRGTAHPVVSLQVAADAEVKHPDDVAVDQFAEVMKAKLADARAKGRSGWQECDPAELSYMLREHVEKGDPRDVANFCMFLWSLGKPIGDARPVVNLQLTPLDGIQVWIEAYTNTANGPHFVGHARIVQLLREYLALRNLLAQRTPPPLPETHYNGCGDGSEPLYTADMMRLYAMEHAATLALPAGLTQHQRDGIQHVLRKYSGMEPEADESWESWYRAAMDMISNEIGEVLAGIPPTAALPAGPVPEGWKLVPLKVNGVMHDAGYKALKAVGVRNLFAGEVNDAYYAMIAAAPQPPASPAVAQPVSDELAAFEKWARDTSGMPGHVPFNWDATWVKNTFEGWQARAALFQPAEEGTKGGA